MTLVRTSPGPASGNSRARLRRDRHRRWHLRSTAVIDAEDQPVAREAAEQSERLDAVRAQPRPSSSGESAERESAAAVAERWLREHGDVLWRFALARTRSREAAEDIVQETLLAALQGRALAKGGASERTWLIGIAAHKVSDHFRAARRRAGGDAARPQKTSFRPQEAEGIAGPDPSADLFTGAGTWARPPGSWGTGAGGAEEGAELLAALRRCLDELPPAQAEAVWLRDLLNIPAPEVCKAMGISATNLWSRMHRARAALRLCVEGATSRTPKGPR